MIERLLTIVIFIVLFFGGFFIALKASSAPHTFSTGLNLQAMVQDAEDSKVSSALLQGYVSAIIDVAWATASSDECVGTPDYDKVNAKLTEILKTVPDKRLAITPAWMLVGLALRFEYPICFEGEETEVKL